MRCKCKYCEKHINTKEAYKITINNKNKYYCTENCYICAENERLNKIKIKAEYDEIFDITKDIFGYEFSSYSLLKKEICAWEKLCSRDKIILYLKENKDWLSSVMNKEFNGDFGRVRYFSVVVSSKLHDYKPMVVEDVKVQSKVQPRVDIDETVYEAPTRSLNKRRSLADLEDEIW